MALTQRSEAAACRMPEAFRGEPSGCRRQTKIIRKYPVTALNTMVIWNIIKKLKSEEVKYMYEKTVKGKSGAETEEYTVRETVKEDVEKISLPRTIHLIPMDRIDGFDVRPGFYEINGATAIPGGVNFTV